MNKTVGSALKSLGTRGRNQKYLRIAVSCYLENANNWNIMFGRRYEEDRSLWRYNQSVRIQRFGVLYSQPLKAVEKGKRRCKPLARRI